jgi:hypothetical protein|tara:strand:- start:991 stop:1173 length:183 start_codon:yes stop_codon:yes gene_type:complete
MIIESIVGLVLNVMMADNASGQNLTRGIIMANKIDNLSKEQVIEETNQIIKDAILEQGEK